MPILVWHFVAWRWINSWWCSSASQIAYETKASFVMPWTLTQKKQKTKKDSNVKIQTMLKYNII